MWLLSPVAPIRNHRSRCHARSLTPRMIYYVSSKLVFAQVTYCTVSILHSAPSFPTLYRLYARSDLPSLVISSAKVSPAIQETYFPSVRHGITANLNQPLFVKTVSVVLHGCFYPWLYASIYTTELLGRWARFDNSHPAHAVAWHCT
jgi:hypothetical protein